MAISHRATTNVSTSSSPATINVPASTANGDLLVMCIQDTGGAVNVPAGFTLIRDTNQSGTIHFATCYRIASSEPASYNITINSGTLRAIMTCFTGFTGTPALDVENGQANASSFTCTAPSITTTVDNDILVWSGSMGAAETTFPAPTGYTEPTNGNVNKRIEQSYILDQGAHGATGSVSATTTGTATANAGHLAGFKITSSVTVASVLATATAAALAPTVQVTTVSVLATATGAGLTPAIRVTVLPPLATATGAALAPGVGVPSVAPPLATASAAGLAPAVRVTVASVVAAASALAASPTIVAAIVSAVASASAAGLTPAIQLVVAPPPATGSGGALGGSLALAISPPAATASAAAPVPVITLVLSSALATATAAASPAQAHRIIEALLRGMVRLVPAIRAALELNPASEIVLTLDLTPAPHADISWESTDRPRADLEDGPAVRGDLEWKA